MNTFSLSLMSERSICHVINCNKTFAFVNFIHRIILFSNHHRTVTLQPTCLLHVCSSALVLSFSNYFQVSELQQFI